MIPAKKSNQKKQKSNFCNSRCVRLTAFFSATIAIAVCASYLFFVNDLSVKGFQLKELAKQSKELSDEKTKLELDALQLGSLARIEAKITSLGLVKVDKTEYITQEDKAVALR